MPPLFPFVHTWPGSSDSFTIDRFQTRLPDSYLVLARPLASRFGPRHIVGPSGETVDQVFAWSAAIGHALDADGLVLVARRGTNDPKGPVIAVAIVEPWEIGPYSKLIGQTLGGYASEDVDREMGRILRAECDRRGRPLANAKPRTGFDWVLL